MQGPSETYRRYGPRLGRLKLRARINQPCPPAMQQQQEQSRSSGHRPTCVLPRPRRDHHARSLMLRCLESFTRSELIKLKERNQRVLRLR